MYVFSLSFLYDFYIHVVLNVFVYAPSPAAVVFHLPPNPLSLYVVTSVTRVSRRLEVGWDSVLFVRC